MPQPVKKKIRETYQSNMLDRDFYTLVVDGNNLLEVAFHGDDRKNPDGFHVGGIYQFLNQLRMMLGKWDFQFCYVMWDGERSGQLRYHYYRDYKANRDKNYEDYGEGMSEYAKVVDSVYRERMRYFASKNGNKYSEEKRAAKEK